MKKYLQNAISYKLKSTRGASLSMALLLFLVCAILGAVVLTAGTASAGRLAEMAEMDRRYYSVTSAADLLAKEIENETVTIVRKEIRETKTETSYTVSGTAGNETVTPGTPSGKKSVTYQTIINNSQGNQPSDKGNQTEDGTIPEVTAGTDVTVDDPSRSFLTSRALALLFGADSGRVTVNSTSAFDASMRAGQHTENGTFTLSHTSSDVDADSLAVSGTYAVNADGSLEFVLTSDDYSLTVRMKPTVTETSETASSGDGNPTVTRSGANYTETVVRTVTVTKTSTVKWTVESMQ